MPFKYPVLSPPPARQIVSSSYCAAAYLTSQGFGPGGSRPCSKVLLLGWSGVEQELEQAVRAAT